MIQIFDDFIPDPERIRQSAIRSGFGKWSPNKGDVGAAFYEGVNFMGDHTAQQRALHKALGPVIVNSMFFRITNPGMEHALIHSDREYGENTAILYLSPNTNKNSGTGFYQHRETGWIDLPALDDLMKRPDFERIRHQMLDASDRDWKLHRFVEAKFNRCLVFDAPKIHCRIPKVGFGTNDNDSRMVWVAHFSKV